MNSASHLPGIRESTRIWAADIQPVPYGAPMLILGIVTGVVLIIISTFEAVIPRRYHYAVLGLGLLAIFLTLLWPITSVVGHPRRQARNFATLAAKWTRRAMNLVAVSILPAKYSLQAPRFRGGLLCSSDCARKLDTLCDLCRSICKESPLISGSSRILIPSEEFYTHHTWQQLEQSAATCQLCRLLIRSVNLKRKPLPITTIHHLRLEIQQIREHYRVNKVFIHISDSSVTSARLYVEPKTFRHICDNSETTNSLKTARIVREWIDRCCTEHHVCQTQHTTGLDGIAFRPTRLLDIGTSHTAQVSLVLGSGLSTSTIEYVALSHCWGLTPMPVRLLPEDRTVVEQGTMSFSFDQLSQNFQDAIVLTRNIGFRYLWIDSLCIMQGSKEDWVIESDRMGLVYSNAICVLSATVSFGHTEGFVRPRVNNKSPLSLIGAKSRRRNAETVEALLVNTETSEEPGMADLFEELVEQAPVTKRGWAFQERVLAKRIVHFCAGIVLFECNTMQASENHIDGTIYPWKSHLRADGSHRDRHELANLVKEDKKLSKIEKFNFGPQGMLDYDNPTVSYAANRDYHTMAEKRMKFFESAALTGMRGDFQLMLQAKRPTTPQEMLAFHCGWFQLVEQYSRRDLTHKSDKLAAILGIARIIEKWVSGRIFVNGAWRETIEFDLLWSVASSEPAPSRIPASDVPAWSWASIDGAVESKLRALYPDSSAVKVVTLVTVTIGGYELEDPKPESTLLIDCCGLLQLRDSFEVILDTVTRDTDGNKGGDARLLYRYLPVLRIRSSGRGRAAATCIHGIVLREKHPAQQSIGHFERVGYFWSNGTLGYNDLGLHGNDSRTTQIALV